MADEFQGEMMDARVQEMIDHHEIRQTLSVYCQGCDRLDLERMAGVYARDSWDDHGNVKCPGREFAERTIDSLRESSHMCSHQLGQSLISVNGDEAGAETYFIASLRRPVQDGGEVLNQMGGRYVDTLQREDGKWKIKTRICVRDWSIDHPMHADWLRTNTFVEGERSPHDPSYEVLGIQPSRTPLIPTGNDLHQHRRHTVRMPQ